MREVRERVAETIAQRGVGDGDVCEMVISHECQHSETMRQTLALAGLLPAGEPPRIDARPPSPEEQSDWLEIPAGSFAMGAGAAGFAYDNERPRHTVALDAFQIARRPVSAASWMRFGEGGGYERREWWSDEGWAWKEEHDITHHPAVTTGDPNATPVCHVSWFEADAFARAHGARLPSEAEWERTARMDEEMPTPIGFTQMGQVWEWTASTFGGYPGSSPIRTASTRRCSSARPTACCAAARGPPARA